MRDLLVILAFLAPFVLGAWAWWKLAGKIGRHIAGED